MDLSLLLHNPEKVQDIGGYDNVADQQSESSGGQKLVDGPKNEGRSEQQAFGQCPAIRPQTGLQERVSNPRQRERKRAKPGMRFR